ncbi:hypothetical protein ACOSQ4_004036 [Xanthoceras sorbifolium]
MPLYFWYDYFQTSVLLINNLPSPMLKMKSPFEILFHRLPNYAFFKVFGCSCIPYLRSYSKQKFDFHTSKCLFIGYSLQQKGYRRLHPSGCIYVSRNFVFNESEFPYLSLFASQLRSSSALLVLPLSVLKTASSTIAPAPIAPTAHQPTTHSPVTSSLPAISSAPASAPEPSWCIDLSAPSTFELATKSVHPIVTRSKSRVLKPVAYSSLCKSVVLAAELVLKSVKEALQHPCWYSAMQEEYHALMKNQTWNLVPAAASVNLVGCKWVFRVKYHQDGSIHKYKARLVAKGFHQTTGIDYSDTFSPVVKASTIQIIFTIVVSNAWDIQQIDINNAFLNGELKEVVYMEQPPGFVNTQFPNHVCQLCKALYGLK